MELKNKRAKRFISIVLSVAMVFCGLTLSTSNVSAEDKTFNDFTYRENSDETVTITDYSNDGPKDVSIPDTIDGKTVTAIGTSAFNMNRLTSVTIPSTVTTIGRSAFFSQCLSSLDAPTLEKVVILGKETTIGDDDLNVFASYTTANFKMYGYAGSTAETYAKDKGTNKTTVYDFVALDDWLTVEDIGNQIWTGSAVEPKLTVKDKYDANKILTKDIDYTVSCTNNTNLGTATVTITGIGEYVGATATKEFKIIPMSISSATVSGISNKAYTGSAITQAGLIVKLGTKTLTAGTDYTVAYKSNVYSGTATVTITGKGNYSGTISKTFAISAPTLSATSSVTCSLYGYDDIQASWRAVSGASGYYVYYKKSTSSSYTYKSYTTGTSMKIANLADGAKYYVRVIPYKTINGKKYAGNYRTSSAIYTFKKLSTPKLSKKSSSKVTVKWTNIAGESGYQISKSTSKSKTGTVYTVKTTTGKSKVISAKRYKTYYYKVRAYRTVGAKKIYGPWSSVKAYKLK